MISANQALVNARGFRRKGFNLSKNQFNEFVDNCLSPRIEMASKSGEFHIALDVSFYDTRIRGFYSSLREVLIKSGFGYDFTNYPEDIVITW